MKNTLPKSFLIWLPFAAVITFVCLLSYGLVQQDLRQTANDPQIEIAEDIARALGTGVPPQEIIPSGQTVDIATSLDPYVIIFDGTGAVLASSAMLHNQTTTVPRGVFASVLAHGEDRFTWQPEHGVRGAVVVDSFSGTASSTSGFVLAGRSLREIEIREDKLSHITLLAWLAGLVVMFGIVWAAVWAYKKKA